MAHVLSLAEQARFPTGQVLMTAGIDDLVRRGRINPTPYLRRHLAGDWGDLSIPSAHPAHPAFRKKRKWLTRRTAAPR